MEITDLPQKYQRQVIAQLKPKKVKAKYGNIKTEVDGHHFDSKKEAEFYVELKMREKAGEVSDIILQPRYELQEAFSKNGKRYRKIEYVADFQYTENGIKRVVDVKGMKTQVYKLKRKMFEHKYEDLEITEK